MAKPGLLKVDFGATRAMDAPPDIPAPPSTRLHALSAVAAARLDGLYSLICSIVKLTGIGEFPGSSPLVTRTSTSTSQATPVASSNDRSIPPHPPRRGLGRPPELKNHVSSPVMCARDTPVLTDGEEARLVRYIKSIESVTYKKDGKSRHGKTYHVDQ